MRRIMKIRIRDIPVRGNFPNASKQTDCPASNCSSKETQIHLYESNCWTKNEENKTLSTTGANYSDIYGRYIQKQFEVMVIMFRKLEKRNIILREDGPLDPRGGNQRNIQKAPNLVIRKAKMKTKPTKVMKSTNKMLHKD